MRFEDLFIWQQGRILANLVYEASSDWRDYSLKDQIRRAVVSISNNIAEGFEREYDGEFLRFLSIARGSCSEVKSITYLALDQGLISQVTQQALYSKADGIGVGIYRLILRIKEKKAAKSPQAQEPVTPYGLAIEGDSIIGISLGDLETWNLGLQNEFKS